MKFSEFGLEPDVVAVTEKLNYFEATPIQDKVIIPITEGKDIAGLAQTGTGKTAAFLVPLIDRVLKGKKSVEGMTEEQEQEHRKRSFAEWKDNHFVLILVPTRELALQVLEHFEQLSQNLGLKGGAVYGGTGYESQKQAFAEGFPFIIATPGRLIELYKEHVVDLKQVRAIVFDEADRMFDMGFKADMKYILQRIPRERQFLVFSATLNFDVLNVAYQFGAEPVEIDVSRDQVKAENVKDTIFHIGHQEKPAHLLSLLKKHQPQQIIIFSNFKHNVERIAKFLQRNDIPAVGISSLLNQSQRNRVMAQFKEGQKSILVATDVAARGLDIKGVDMVINYELPQDAENYVHRIGRTGRAGEVGLAFSLVSDKDVESLERIETFLKHKIDQGWLEDIELVKEFIPFPEEEEGYRRSYPQGNSKYQENRKRSGSRDHGKRREGHGSDRRDQGPRSEERQYDRNDRDKADRGQRKDYSDRGEGRNRKNFNKKFSRDESAEERSERQDRKERRHQGGQEGRKRDSDQIQLQTSYRHRDRLTGRHSKSGERYSKNKESGNKNHSSRQTSKEGHEQKSEAGIGKKVSGFFKKIFKSNKKSKTDEK